MNTFNKILRWVVIIWTFFSVPYLFDSYSMDGDVFTLFFGLVYVGLIIGLMVDDLRN